MKSAKKTDAGHLNKKVSQEEELHARMGQAASEPTIGAAIPGIKSAVSPASENGDELPAVPSAADDRLLRLQADFDNYRKRVLREKEDLYQRANENIMDALLPVLDHLDLAISFADDGKQDDAVIKGFKIVGEQLFSVLEKFGLAPIHPQSVEFDPNIHEAILHMPSEEIPENKIISKTRTGYMLGGRLLRAAQVVVSSGPPSQDDADTGL